MLSRPVPLNYRGVYHLPEWTIYNLEFGYQWNLLLNCNILLLWLIPPSTLIAPSIPCCSKNTCLNLTLCRSRPWTHKKIPHFQKVFFSSEQSSFSITQFPSGYWIEPYKWILRLFFWRQWHLLNESWRLPRENCMEQRDAASWGLTYDSYQSGETLTVIRSIIKTYITPDGRSLHRDKKRVGQPERASHNKWHATNSGKAL